MTDDENMTARFADEITSGDLFETALRYDQAGVEARLCQRGPFSACDSPPCTKFWAAVRGQE